MGFDIDKIRSEFAKIRGKKISYDDALVYIEDLVPGGTGDEEPLVLLSNDAKISLVEAINYVDSTPPPSNNSGGGGGNQQQFFPEVQYDPETGIPIISSIAQSEEDINEVQQKIAVKTAEELSPVAILVKTAKKINKEIIVKFNVEVIQSDLFNVLKMSYTEEEVTKVLSADITRQVIEQVEERIKENLNTLLTT